MKDWSTPFLGGHDKVILTAGKNTLYFSALIGLPPSGICVGGLFWFAGFCFVFFSGLSILLLPGEVWFPRNIFTNFLTFLIPSIEPRRTISGWAVDIADNLDLCLFLLTAIHCKTEIIPLPSLSQVLAVQKKRPLTFLKCYSGKQILRQSEIRGWILHSQTWFSAAILSTGNGVLW